MKTLNCDNLVSRQVLAVIFLLFCIFPLTTVYAIEIDFNTMLYAVKENAEPLIRFVVAVAYVIGLWFVFSAISALKRAGQSTMHMQAMSLGGPILKLILGILLIYLPTTIDVGMLTIWEYGTESGGLMSYEASGADPFGPAKEGAIAIVRVVGYISFVRGFVILSRAGNPGGQPGTFGKGLIHIIGGIMAINVVGTIRIIANTLGFGAI